MSTITAYGGGGKKGGSSRRPEEHPDNLHSIARARILDLISEGPIVGAVTGPDFLKSYYINGTPIQNADGSYNFPDVVAEYTLGTQDQDYIKGFPASESTVMVSAELKSGTPWTQVVTNPNLSALVISLGVSALVETNAENYDRMGTVVNYRIQLRTGTSGAFNTVIETSFNGKASSQYVRSHRINLPAGQSWAVRVIRDTPDSTTDLLQNATFVQSYTEVIDQKLRYPMSALVGISISAENFNGIPTRSFKARGRIIRVPSNYNPTTRAYSGVWDGTFKQAWTDNPAWIYYDLLTNDRYGLGSRIQSHQIDRYTLYRIARYCDELVPDGFGGKEPRFTCNVYITKASDALRVLSDLAGTFRGISYWASGLVRISADIPIDPVYEFTNANVKNGRFERTSSANRQRFSVAAVSYNDMEDFGRQKVEFVQDNAAVQRYGIRERQITAFGCTSPGQAHRVGKYQLVTSQVETGGITFTVGLENIRVQPGDVVRVRDANFAGRRASGRVAVNQGGGRDLVLDSAKDVAPGSRIRITKGDYQSTFTVSIVSGNNIKLNNVPQIDVRGGFWSIESADLVPELYRIISIKEMGGSSIEYEINAVQHEPQKYSAVDYGTRIESSPVTVIPPRAQDAPKNVKLSSYYLIKEAVSRHTLVITWDKAKNASRYEAQFRRNNSNWVSLPQTGSTSIEVDNVYVGLYEARVRAINALDVPSLWAYGAATELDGLVGEPPRVTSLTTEGVPWGINLRWGFSSGPNIIGYSEVRYGPSSDFNDSSVLGQYAYPTNSFAHQGLKIDAEFFYWVRLLDKNGVAGAWYPYESQPGIRGMPSQIAEGYNDLITKEILESALGEQLFEDIESIEDLWQNLAELGIDVEGLGIQVAEVDGKFVVVNSRLDSMNNRFAGLDDEIDAITAQVAELAGTATWDPEQTYLAGQIVKFNGALYRAIQDVPENTPVSNAGYWEKVGNFDSINDLVTSLASRMTTAETGIDELTGAVTAHASDIAQLQSQVVDLDEGVRGTSSAVSELETNVAKIGDKIEVTSKQTNVLASTLRGSDDDNGRLADVLNEYASRAWIKENRETIVTNENAQAIVNNQLQSSVNGVTSSVQDLSSTVSTIDGKVAATRTIKVGVDNNGTRYMAGLGVGVDNATGDMQSQVVALADRFSVMNAINETPKAVFTVAGGVVFMDSAMIQDASITSAKVGDLRSTNYVAGVSGWRLDRNGNLEMNGSSGGNRMTFSNGLIQVFDSNGRLRVRMGIW